MPDPCIDLLTQLVAIDSVNPSLMPGAAGEGGIAAAIAEHLRGLGLEVHLQEVAPGRPNVIGVLDSGVDGPSMLFCGHTDTVGVEGMAAPFTPSLRDGRLYGRGSQDMKGGLAAMIDAARVLRNRGLTRGRLIVAAVIDEEFLSLGADELVKTWHADAAVVTEPTDLQIGVGHKGFAWFEIETTGRAAHGSRPKDGRDAIFAMSRVLARLEALDHALQAGPAHPVMGAPSLHASIIDGGREWSVYPDRCRLRMERRTIAGETLEVAEREVRAILDALHAEDQEFEAAMRVRFSRPPYETPPTHALPGLLARCAAARGVTALRQGLSFWTDAAVLGEAGVPSVLFGPGGAGLHSTEEYVQVAEVIACRDVLADVAHAWLTAENRDSAAGS
ncbi:ArgE/DapE family deacylase [soil metagenome]